MTIVRPPNVGFYAVAKSHAGKVLIASGPHDAGLAHALVDSEVRREARARHLTFPEFGVIRMVGRPDQALPTLTIETGRVAA